jgi:hypothetical protein
MQQFPESLLSGTGQICKKKNKIKNFFPPLGPVSGPVWAQYTTQYGLAHSFMELSICE